MGDNNNLYYESENGEASVNVEGSNSEDSRVASPIDVANNHAYRDPYTNEILYGKADLYKLNKTIEPGETYTLPDGFHEGTIIKAKDITDFTYGTATADDIAFNKTAWVNGKKVIGTSKASNIPELSATVDDVVDGKTFIGRDRTQATGTIRKTVGHGNDKTITEPINLDGYYKDVTISPIDMSEDDATADHLLLGYTAHSKGKKIVGTMHLGEEAAATISTSNQAQPEDVLETKRFARPQDDGMDVIIENGKMKVNAPQNIILDNGDLYNIPKGYHNGTGTLTAPTLESKTPGNATSDDIAIGKKAWVNGAAVTGTARPDSGIPEVTAVADDVLEGKTFVGSDKTKSTGTLNIEKKAIDLIRVTGPAHVGDVLEGKGIVRVSDDGRSIVKEVGTIKRNAPVYKKLNDGESYTVPIGYHSGQGNIYTPTLKEKTPGDATKYDLADGKIAWVDGKKITANTNTLKEYDTLENTTISDIRLTIEGEDAELNGIYGMSHNVMGNRRLIFDKFPPSSIDKIYKNTNPNPVDDILTNGKNFNNYIFAIPTPDMSYGYIEKTDGDGYRFVKNTNENYAKSLSGMIYADKLISIDQVVVNLYDGDTNHRQLVYSVSARYDVEYYKKNHSRSEIGKHIKHMLDNQNVIYNGMNGHFTTITNENMSFAIAFTPPLKHTDDDGFGNFGIGIFPCLDYGKHALMRLFEYSMKEKDQNANILAFGNGIALFAEVKFFGVRYEE